MEYYVSSEFRHKGYGKAMFEHTVSWYNECFLQPLLLQESHSGRRSAFKKPEKDRRKMDWTFMKRTLIYRILPYSVIPVNSDDAVSVMTFYQQNIESLHLSLIHISRRRIQNKRNKLILTFLPGESDSPRRTLS